MLLHTVNTVAIAIALGNYDGGTGPSQPETEKLKSTRHFFVAEQLGWDLHDSGVELDTELPTILNIAENGNSGWEPKRNRVPQKSKLLKVRLENGQRSKHVFKIRKVESVNAERCKFEVGSGNSARTFYQVHIFTHTFCCCPGLCANTHCLLCCFHWKLRILTFWIKLNFRNMKLWTF